MKNSGQPPLTRQSPLARKVFGTAELAPSDDTSPRRTAKNYKVKKNYKMNLSSCAVKDRVGMQGFARCHGDSPLHSERHLLDFAEVLLRLHRLADSAGARFYQVADSRPPWKL